MAAQPQRDLLREGGGGRLVRAGRRRAEHERARAGDVAAHVRIGTADVADDEILVGRLAERVRATIQGMVDKMIAERQSVWFG